MTVDQIKQQKLETFDPVTLSVIGGLLGGGQGGGILTDSLGCNVFDSKCRRLAEENMEAQAALQGAALASQNAALSLKNKIWIIGGSLAAFGLIILLIFILKK